MAFSTSSLTTDAGRSTTSPAAIWFARSAGRRMILDITNVKRRAELSSALRTEGCHAIVRSAQLQLRAPLIPHFDGERGLRGGEARHRHSIGRRAHVIEAD